MDNLTIARDKIDEIDMQMARLFCERMNVVCDVLEYKKQHNLPVLDATREQSVIEKNINRLPDKTYEKYYEHFIKSTMEISRAMQSENLAQNTVAYQGALGAFSHIAAVDLFKHGKHKPCASFKDVFLCVENGDAKFGVLPFENSHAGDITDVLDLCFAHDNIVVSATYDLPVRHNLLCINGAKLSDVKTVYSHAQALMQSRAFLEKLNLNSSEMPNTALAAKFVAESADKSFAAIASLQTAQIYGLDVLAKDINSSENNTTRFIVIERKNTDLPPNYAPQSELNKQQRFSLLFTVSHNAGSLVKVLAAIAKHGYNMDCIKSRPMPNVNWVYYFYTEILGTPCDELFAELNLHCNTVRLLGVYTNKTD